MPKSRVGWVAAAIILVAILFLIWGYIKYPRFLTSTPATDSICGVWVIDPDLTTGDEGPRLLQADQQPHGYLELKVDGRFALQMMPKFWEHPISSYEPASASGTWRWETDNNGWVMLNLYFEQVGDKKAGEWDWGHSYVQQKRSAYFLYFIRDFDSSDFLVLRKSQ